MGFRVRRFVLTGMPGSGKTVLLRRMETLGYAVVEEAATDVIALEDARGGIPRTRFRVRGCAAGDDR